MPESKRFRTRHDHDPHLEVGARHVFEPADVVEEWSTGSLCRPTAIDQFTPRPGNVLRVIEPRPLDGRYDWEIMAEDPAPLRVSTGSIMAVLGTMPMRFPIRKLLEHVSSRKIRSEAEAAAVANAIAPWLRETYPHLSRIVNHVPERLTGPQMDTWLDGVRVGLGYDDVWVPVPPFRLVHTGPTIPPAIAGTLDLSVATDVNDRLQRGNRAN